MRYLTVLAVFVCLMLVFGCAAQQSPPAQQQPAAPQAIVPEPADNIANAPPAQPPLAENASEETLQQAPPSLPPVANETEPPAALEIPASVDNNCVGFLLGVPDEMGTAAAADAGIVRPHPGPFAWGFIQKEKEGGFDWQATDAYVKAAGDNNVAILATVWPFADWDQVCQTSCKVTQQDQFYPREKFGVTGGIPASRCKPCGMDAYKKFLSALVERYDGDGKDDMPGLVMPVKYYEILNEPEMNSPQLTFFKGTAQEYVDILAASYEAISETCDGCKTVQGGAAGNDAQFLSFWKEVFAAGGEQYFDIANVHYIAHGDKSTLNVAPFKSLMASYGIEKPIWVTEAEYNMGESVTASFDGALAAGASKIFFTRFEIGNTGPPAPGVYSEEYKGLAAKCPG